MCLTGTVSEIKLFQCIVTKFVSNTGIYSSSDRVAVVYLV
jgi:hypothetical protein